MHPICVACGTQFADAASPPETCPICAEERQFVRWDGQGWTDLDALRREHRLVLADEHGVLGIDIRPPFGIGQRAFLVETPAGNVLWDCVSLVDDAAVAAIRARGGVAAIAISHPHYYTSMVEWSRAFDGAPIHLHADDRGWVQRPDGAIVYWQGERLDLMPGLALIRCGGHFAGATVLHREGGGGDLFVGDVLQVGQDRASVSPMRSYPNYIPLGPASLARIEAALAPFRFERIHGAFRDKSVARDGKAVVARSLTRYRAAIADGYELSATR